MHRAKSLLLFSLILSLSLSLVIPLDAEAAKSKGTSASRIGADEICGDKICDSKMSTDEKLGYYLLNFLEIPEDTVIQQSRFMMGGVAQQNFGSVQIGTVGTSFNSFPTTSLIDTGFRNSLAAPITVPGTIAINSAPNVALSPNIGIQSSPSANIQIAPNITPQVTSPVATNFANTFSANQLATAGIPVASFNQEWSTLTSKPDFTLQVDGAGKVQLPSGVTMNNLAQRDLFVMAPTTTSVNLKDIGTLNPNQFVHVVNEMKVLPDVLDSSNIMIKLPSKFILDSDGDGITDDKDQCPTQKEDFDGVEDTDGCPDNALVMVRAVPTWSNQDPILVSEVGVPVLTTGGMSDSTSIGQPSPYYERMVYWGVGLASVVTTFLSDNGHLYVDGHNKVTVFDSDDIDSDESYPLGNKLLEIMASPCHLDYVNPSSIDCTDPDGDGPLELGDGQFPDPRGITALANGNLYVSDNYNDRILIFDSDGNFVSKFGSSGDGPNQLDGPTSIMIGNNNVYVLDENNKRVQVFDLSGNFVQTIGAGILDSPTSLTIQKNTNSLYVLDDDLRETGPYSSSRAAEIHIFDSNGDFVKSMFTGNYRGSALSVDQSGRIFLLQTTGYSVYGDGPEKINVYDNNGVLIGSGPDASNSFPNLSVHVDDGALSSKVWIIYKQHSPSIQNINAEVYNIEQFFPVVIEPTLIIGSTGTAPAQFDGISDMVIKNDKIYVADSGNDRIQILDLQGNFVSEIDGSGKVAVDNTGKIYVSDRDKINVFDANGNFDFEFGTPCNVNSPTDVNCIDPDGDGSLEYGDGQFDYSIHAIAVDDAGQIYASDNSRISIFDSSGNFIEKISRTQIGGCSGWSNVDSLETVGSQLWIAAGASSWGIYVYDSVDTCNKFATNYSGMDGWPREPGGLEIDTANNKVYVAERGRIQVFDMNGNYIGKFGKTGDLPGEFSTYAQEVEVDSSGKLYVADSTNDRIQVFTFGN